MSIWNLTSSGFGLHTSFEAPSSLQKAFFVDLVDAATLNKHIGVVSIHTHSLSLVSVDQLISADKAFTSAIRHVAVSPDRSTAFLIFDEFEFCELAILKHGGFGVQIQDYLSLHTASVETKLGICWIDSRTLALTYGGSSVLIHDLDSEESFPLSIPDTEEMRFDCCSFNASRSLLSVGTDTGHVLMWQSHRRSISDSGILSGEPTLAWKPIPKINLGGAVDHLSWGISDRFLIARRRGVLKIIGERSTLSAVGRELAVLQKSADCFTCSSLLDPTKKLDLFTSDAFRGLTVNKRFVAFRGSINVKVYEIAEDFKSSNLLSRHSAKCIAAYACSTGVLLVFSKLLEFRKHDGALQELIKLPADVETILTSAHMGSTVALLCPNKIISISLDKATPSIMRTVELKLALENLRDFKSFCVSSSSDSVAFISSSNLTIVHLKANIIQTATINSDTEHVEWDAVDDRLLVCYRALRPEVPSDIEVILFYTSPQTGIHLFERKPITGVRVFMGIRSPFLVLLHSTDLEVKSMTLFDSIEVNTEKITKAIHDFASLAASGNVKDATKFLKNLPERNLWWNLAQTCLSTRNLDLIILCFGHLGLVSALNDVAAINGSEDLKWATFAVHLGCVHEAEKILDDSKLYPAAIHLRHRMNRHDLAVQIAERHHGVALRSSCHQYARYHEEEGDLDRARVLYEQCDNASGEIPRMLLKNPRGLKSVIDRSDEREMKVWWARYMEVRGDFGAAFDYFTASHDAAGSVRSLLAQNRVDDAESVLENSKDTASLAAARFQLAEFYERTGDIQRALLHYDKAGCTHHALRMAKSHHLDADLMRLALRSPPLTQRDIAVYFQQRNQPEKALGLLIKSGDLHQVLEKMTEIRDEALMDQQVLPRVLSSGDSRLIEQCADIYYEYGNLERALDLFSRCNVSRFLKLLVTPTKKALKVTASHLDYLDRQSPAPTPAQFKHLASVLMTQKDFTTASKYYVKSGHLDHAVRALISGSEADDGVTTSLVSFIGALGPKDTDALTVAAEHLRSHPLLLSTPSLYMALVGVYSKLKQFESVMDLYRVLATDAIHQRGDYAQASRFLRDSLRAMPPTGVTTELIKCDLRDVEKFARVQELASSDTVLDSTPLLLLEIDALLSQAPTVPTDVAVDAKRQLLQRGDVYAFAIEFCADTNQMERAQAYFQKMKSEFDREHGSVVLGQFLDADLLARLGA